MLPFTRTFKPLIVSFVVLNFVILPISKNANAVNVPDPENKNKLAASALNSEKFIAAGKNIKTLVDNMNLAQALSAQTKKNTKATFSVSKNLLQAAAESTTPADWFLQNQNTVSGLFVSNPDDPNFITDGDNNKIKIYAKDQAYTYDQAVGGIALLQNGNVNAADAAKKIFNFYYDNWQSKSRSFNGFDTVYTVDPSGRKYEWRQGTGENAWIGLFCLQYEAFSSEVNEKKKALDLAASIANWIKKLPHNNGGVAMGVSNPGGNPDFGNIFSTENNMDYYALLKTLSVLAPDASDRQNFTSELASVNGWLRSAYDPKKGLFCRGGSVNANGQMVWDSLQSLDSNSWALTAIGIQTLKDDFKINIDEFVTKIGDAFAVQRNGAFGGDLLTAKGFDFSSKPNADLIGRKGIKWVEGTNEMILNYRLLQKYYSNDPAKSGSYRALADYFSGLNVNNALGSGYAQTDQSNTPIYADSRNVKTVQGQSAGSTGWVCFSSNIVNPFDRPRASADANTGTLLVLLQADSARRNDFNNLYGTAIPQWGQASHDDRTCLLNVTSEPAFDFTTFFASLSKTAGFYTALKSNSADLFNLNILYGTTLQITKAPSASDSRILFDITKDPSFDQVSFLAALSKPANLCAALQGFSGYVAGFNILYGASLQGSGAPSADDRKIISDIANDPVFDETKFLGALLKAARLYTIFQASPTDSTNVTNFNLLYGTSLSVTGSLNNAADRAVLFSLVSDPAYGQASFLAILPRAAGLYAALSADATNLAAFNSLYGTALRGTNASDNAYARGVLFGISSDPGYIQSNFLKALPKASGLYTALQANPANATNVNLLYGTSLSVTGSLNNAAYRAVLFSLVSDPAYGQAGFLSALPKVASFYSALQADSFSVTYFNVLYGTTFKMSGPLSLNDGGVLFGVVCDPGFVQGNFMAVLDKAGSLLTAMQQPSTAAMDLKYFNRLFGTALEGAAPTAADRGMLFNLAGDPAFNTNNFIFSMRKAGHLYFSLINKPKLLKKFNKKYKTSLKAGKVSPQQRGLLFNITRKPNFKEQAFLNSL